MKVILDIDDGLMKRLHKEADCRGTTIMALIEDAFRLELAKLSASKDGGKDDVSLPGWNGVDFLVKISNVEEIYRAEAEDRMTGALPPLPTFKTGGLLIDVSNRDEIFRILDEERSIGL